MAKKSQTVTESPRIASTGSRSVDENADERHAAVLEGIGVVEVPGTTPLQIIVFDGVHYSHVAEDAEGRWIYRKL